MLVPWDAIATVAARRRSVPTWRHVEVEGAVVSDAAAREQLTSRS